MKIPKDAGFFCTVDYGGSEGIYLDVYLKWFDEQKKESVTKTFITGKTLGETGSDLDRMYLIASAVTKAFNGDGTVHSRYIRLGEPGASDGMLLHLNGEERRLLVDSLVEHRERLQTEFVGVEQLLRRVTGSITAFVDEVGERPLRIGDYDKAVLAIEDGNLPAFQEAVSKVPDQTANLLIRAAGRPGAVGRKMSMLLLGGAKGLTGEQYLRASQAAIDTGDLKKVRLLYEQAENCVADLPETYYGDVIAHAYGKMKHIAHALLKQSTPEQIGGASPRLLQMAAMQEDYLTVSELVNKGIRTNEAVADVIRSFRQSPWAVRNLLEQGMEIGADNYAALHACVNAGNTEAAQMLLDRGMNFDGYTDWIEKNSQIHPLTNQEAFDALNEHWKQETAAPAPEQQPEGPTMGGM